MPHHYSVFHAVSAQFPWDALKRLAEQHDAAGPARTFRCKGQLVSLLHGRNAELARH